MNKNIENYVQRANTAIKLLKLEKKGVISDTIKAKQIKKEIIKTLNFKNPFLISSDVPQNKDDIDILEKVLEIDDKIIYITDDINNVRYLKEKYPNRVFEVDEDLYILAFVVDIHIFFWDRILYRLLEENGKNFWTMHPKDTPIRKGIELPRNLKEDKNLMKFLFGKEYKNIKNRINIAKFWFGDILNEDEIVEFANTSGIELFYLNIKYSINKKNFLNTMLKQRLKSCKYNKSQQVNNISIQKQHISIEDFLKILN